jgi:hypothetical protein
LSDHGGSANGLLEGKRCLEVAGTIEIDDAFEEQRILDVELA